MKDQLHQLEIEKDETKERASVADAAVSIVVCYYQVLSLLYFSMKKFVVS